MPPFLQKPLCGFFLGSGLRHFMEDRDRMDAAAQRGLVRRHPSAMMPNNIPWAPIQPRRAPHARIPYRHLQFPCDIAPCPDCGGMVPSRQAMTFDGHRSDCPMGQYLLRQRSRRLPHRLPPGYRQPGRYIDDPRVWRHEHDDLVPYGDMPGLGNHYDYDDNDYEIDEDGRIVYDEDYDGHSDFSHRSYPRHRPNRHRQLHRGHAPHTLAPPYPGYHGGAGMPPEHRYDDPYATYPGYQGGHPHGYSESSSGDSW